MTPWGEADSVHKVTDGIIFYHTPRHGGYLITDARREEMPEALREFQTFAGGNWYEEDCDAGLIVLAFPAHFSPYAVWTCLAHVKQMTDTARFENLRYYPKWYGLLDRWGGPERDLVEEIAAKWEREHTGWWQRGSMWTIRDREGWGANFRSIPNGTCVTRYISSEEYLHLPEVTENLPGLPLKD